MRKTVSFLLGLFSGAMVGGIVAILLTPYSGTELQEQIRTRVQDLVEEGRRAATLRRAELERQLEAFKRGTPVVIEPATEPATGEQPQA